MKGTPMIKAVLFDLDGTLVDTELLSARAWLASGERLGLDVGEELIKSFVGRTADAVTNMLVEHLGITEATAQELFSLHRSIKEELMENELAAKPFAVKALSVLKDHGFALGLATSSYRPVAERELEPFGMQAYFDSITCGDEIEHGKPAPDIYLLAAERLGMWPEECAVVEDSPNGVRAGAAAGMPVFLVPDTIEPTPEIRSMCVDVLGSLDELAGAIRLRNEEIA